MTTKLEPNLEGVRCLREDFAIDVFDDIKMREYLPHLAYKKLSALLASGEHQIIDIELANDVANSMKNWAVSRGATHFSHWFQPMTGETAEKQECFIGHFDPLGRPLLEFSGDILVRGEPDASSFPNGGLRCTHQARGYTLWDPQSPAFLRHYRFGSVLCVPTAFGSWTGEALDHKVPLLKSEDAVTREAIKTLHLIGDSLSARVFTTLGCEQEFFVIDREKYLTRLDLVSCDRTVIGAKPVKGQELEDQYFKIMPKRVMELVQDIECSLWKLGVPTKTRHNEVAPAQHEIAPVFEPSSLAVDHQMLTMTVMQEKAREHGFEILLHEKPFAYVNGSGKHNNYSLCTDTGVNLFEPGAELMKNPSTAFDSIEHLRFTVFLAAFIQAIDDYAGAIRCSIASHSQDLRLGANEAPPAIISIYLGKSLTDFVDAVIDTQGSMNTGLLSPKAIRERSLPLITNDNIRFACLPTLRRDRTDRNRTSPCAFVGNKFELRAVGASMNSAVPVTAMNSALCMSLRKINAHIEALVNKGESKSKAVQTVVIETLKSHYRIIFDGNGYSTEWVEESAKRGLLNFKTTPDAFELADLKSLYVPTGVFTEREVDARVNVALETYIKNMKIEGRTMIKMAETMVLPAAEKSLVRLTDVSKAVGGKGFRMRLEKLTAATDKLMTSVEELREIMNHDDDDLLREAKMIDRKAKPIMADLREACDTIETMVAAEDWKMATYHDLLFLVS